MKSPSLLALAAILALAAPALAADPPHRCNTDWLKAPVPANAPAGALMDGKIMISDASPLCDKPVWRFLGGPRPATGNDMRTPVEPGLNALWGDLEHQVKVVTFADALFFHADKAADAAIIDGNRVMEAAVTAGLATKGSPASLTALGTDGLAGSRYAAGSVVALTKVASPARIEGDGKTAAFRELLAVTTAGGAERRTPGGAAHLFRKRIVELARIVFTRAAARADAGLSAEIVVNQDRTTHAFVTATNLDAAADTDAVYADALAYLVGDPTGYSGADRGDHTDAALSKLDYGMRDLIANLALALRVAVDAAGSVAAPVRAAPTAGANAFGNEAVAALRANPDFAALSALFDHNKANTAWLNDPQKGVKVQAELRRMEEYAAAARLNGGTLTQAVTEGGAKHLRSMPVPGVVNAALRRELVDSVVQDIINDPLNGFNLHAFLQAMGTGAAVVPDPIPAVVVSNPASTVVTGDEWKRIQDFDRQFGDHGWFAHSVMQQYREHKEAEAAEAAARTAAARLAVQTAANEARERATAACRTRFGRTPNPLYDVEGICRAEGDKAFADARGVANFRDTNFADQTAARRQAHDAANAEIGKAYDQAIVGAVGRLHTQYKAYTPMRRGGGGRAYDLANETGYYQNYTDPRVLAAVEAYFTEKWSGAGLAASLAKVRGKLWVQHPAAHGAGYDELTDPTDENVDEYIHADLVGVLNGLKGSIKVAPPAR